MQILSNAAGKSFGKLCANVSSKQVGLLVRSWAILSSRSEDFERDRNPAVTRYLPFVTISTITKLFLYLEIDAINLLLISVKNLLDVITGLGYQ